MSPAASSCVPTVTSCHTATPMENQTMVTWPQWPSSPSAADTVAASRLPEP